MSSKLGENMKGSAFVLLVMILCFCMLRDLFSIHRFCFCFRFCHVFVAVYVCD